MLIILYNYAHNGDVFFTQKFVKYFVKSNPDKNFLILLSCSKAIYNNINKEYENATIEYLHENKYGRGINRTKLWYKNGDKIIISLHKVLTDNNSCINICRHGFIQDLTNNIFKSTNIKINFNCDNNFIPSLKNLINWDTNEISNIFKEYNSKIIFYYNIKTISNKSKNNNIKYRENLVKRLQIFENNG